MNPWFETSIETRSYELDAFGHLNHAVYLNYFEVARIKLLEEAGYPVQDLLDHGHATPLGLVQAGADAKELPHEGFLLVVHLDAHDMNPPASFQEVLHRVPRLFETLDPCHLEVIQGDGVVQ
ncbi:MAG: acyl-CoA thioesterase, partial [Longimicrobiales bacterium]|nr:acyl-CoA thioesterase [Longimicrobiales bacterium]